MANDPRVEQLLEEIVVSGNPPEEVCRACPELLPVVLESLQRLRAVEAELAAIFPTHSPKPGDPGSIPSLTDSPLPVVPGYTVSSLLGRGGMGVVYKAQHLKLNRIVAIKMLLAGGFATPAELGRFMREAQAIAGLRHPNIVQVYDVGDLDGRPYFTMEYVEGGSLAQKLAGVPQPARQAASMVATLAEAVQAAHNGGIVHRDVKPANILLTADGTPKITDFGLARRYKEGSDLTLGGTRLGTPSYMSPEQAIGRDGAVGPSADIYSLGAVLYEMLTGRPPFRAETPAETERQVIVREPAPPSQLNAKVPRDLETICLKCLQKDPSRRYATAAGLAADLQRFLRNEPILARPVSWVERCLRWMGRNPTSAGLIITALALAALISVFAVREVATAAQRRAEAAKWAERLQYVMGLQEAGRYVEARGILGRVPDGGSVELHRQIELAQADLDLAERLDSIRLSRGAYLRPGGLDYDRSSQEYEAAFHGAGLGDLKDDSQGVAEKVRNSSVRKALVAALDDWAACARVETRAWVLSVVRAVDPDPWRDQVRDQERWADTDHLAQLAKVADVHHQPITLMVAMATRWRRLGGDPTVFLQRVYRVHPDDFWLNFELGHLTLVSKPLVSIGYSRAALAIRPQAVAARLTLGVGFATTGQNDEAIEQYERVLAQYPDHAMAHLNLGLCFLVSGRLDESLPHLQSALALEPTLTKARAGLSQAMARLGRWEEARTSWAPVLESDSFDHDDCEGYAELCLFLGHEDGYRHACDVMLARFASANDPHICETTSRACLLAPSSAETLKQAEALVDRAVEAGRASHSWALPYFMFAKGLAEYREGRFDSAADIMRGDAANVLQPAPQLVLAMALQCKGQKEEAKLVLTAAICHINWWPRDSNYREAWMNQVLRREAVSMILPEARAFLDGKYVPRDNEGRLILTAECQLQNRFATLSKLYWESFSADPSLIDHLDRSVRYNAITAAALAGSGLGTDAQSLDEAQRAAWREQSRQWLLVDVAAMRDLVRDPKEWGRVRAIVTRWLASPDLAGIRDPEYLSTRTTDEMERFTEFWVEVQGLQKASEESK